MNIRGSLGSCLLTERERERAREAGREGKRQNERRRETERDKGKQRAAERTGTVRGGEGRGGTGEFENNQQAARRK